MDLASTKLRHDNLGLDLSIAHECNYIVTLVALEALYQLCNTLGHDNIIIVVIVAVVVASGGTYLKPHTHRTIPERYGSGSATVNANQV